MKVLLLHNRKITNSEFLDLFKKEYPKLNDGWVSYNVKKFSKFKSTFRCHAIYIDAVSVSMDDINKLNAKIFEGIDTKRRIVINSTYIDNIQYFWIFNLNKYKKD